MNFKDILHKRYAVKKFDSRIVPESKMNELFELIHLAPTSFNIQPYVVKVIRDKSMKEKLAPAAWNQPQVTTCSHLLVFCANTDISGNIDKLEKQALEGAGDSEAVQAYIKMMRDFEKGMSHEQKLAWAQKQVYLPFGNALNGAIELGLDSSPMEGFNPKEFAKILELPDNIVPTVLCAIGHAADQPRPKTRFPVKELFI
jgi:nitroreductase